MRGNWVEFSIFMVMLAIQLAILVALANRGPAPAPASSTLKMTCEPVIVNGAKRLLCE